MHDIHTHLCMPQYDADRNAVIARARAVGIDGMFVIGCTIDESRECVTLATQYPEIFASVGIHPHAFRTVDDANNLEADIAALRTMAKESMKVIAIGECGLDYYVRSATKNPQQSFVGRGTKTFSEETKAVQRQGFLAQISLARELKLPLIIHCRDAYDDMLTILRTEAMDIAECILHCYMGDTEVTKRFLELPNVAFSFAGNITYPVKSKIQGTKDDMTETVRLIPLDRLFVETDCPFLSPQSVRGQRNEPAHVVLAAQEVARLRGVSSEEVREILEVNFRRVFGKRVQ